MLKVWGFSFKEQVFKFTNYLNILRNAAFAREAVPLACGLQPLIEFSWQLHEVGQMR